MAFMDECLHRARQQRATRTVFFIAGLAMSGWAPLIPFVKAQHAASDAMLGLLLFCIAAGSMSMMPFTGRLIQRYGYRRLILLSCAGFCFDLPLIIAADTLAVTVLALLLFGALNGVLDVTMNAQAVVVERESGSAKMSGFHGFYSIGTIAGAGLVSFLLSMNVAPLLALALIVVLIVILSIIAAPALQVPVLATADQGGTLLALRHPPVLIIALLCFCLFLCEGAMLDWSAVLMHNVHHIPLEQAGIGFTCYSLAVTLSRLTGDRLIARWGKQPVLLSGALMAAIGLLLATWGDLFWLNLLGFMLTGLGIANLVPVLFSAAGNLSLAAAEYAIPAVTLIGYAGLLTGPALIGFSAQWAGLAQVFSLLALLLLVTGTATSLLLHSLKK